MGKTYFSKLTFLLLAAAWLISGCATIVSRSAHPVSVDTRPEGATVMITDKKGKVVYKGSSPSTVLLKSGAGYFSRAEYQVRITAPGYAEQIIPVLYKLNGWYFGNLLIGGPIGMLVIDPVTGAMWRPETPPIFVKLQPLHTSSQALGLQILYMQEFPKELKAHWVRIK